jgi:hypothetical protein
LEIDMAFSREDLAAYEKGPQKTVDDKVNPFRGATPAKAADAASVAAVAAGQIDATPGGAAAAADTAPLVDDSPVVDEDGTIGDPTESGEGTSDENSEGSSASAVDPGDEADPNTDLTGEEATEEVAARPAPKKGSAQERIVEALDLADGYKEFGRHMQEQLKEALTENARLRGGGTATPTTAVAAPPAPVEDTPMPDMADADINFDADKYRTKMQKWVKDQVKSGTAQALREATGVDRAEKVRSEVEQKCTTFAKEHPDFEKIVTKNPVLAQNQLAPDAGFAVAQSEHTADLLYQFGKDAGLAIRVARQSPAQQLLTIGRMIEKIEAEKAAAKPATTSGSAKPAPKKSITQAPPPPSATRAAGRAAARDVLDPGTSMDEFARQHRAGKQSARETSRKARGLN